MLKRPSASAIATIDRIAPGRLTVGIGTGFTARRVLDQKPLTWAVTERYVRQLRSLLAGEVVEIDGRSCQMVHHPAMAKPRPIEVPIILSAVGPKGQAIARTISDGLMGFAEDDTSFSPYVRMISGTVLEPGESAHSRRVTDAVGPWWTVGYHGLWAASGPAQVEGHSKLH